MFVDVKRNDSKLVLALLHPRIDGSNHLLDAVNEFTRQSGGLPAIADLTEIEIDFAGVTYLNSMGITELVNIYRYLTAQSRGRIQFRFSNVMPRIHSILDLVEFTKLADVQKRDQSG